MRQTGKASLTSNIWAEFAKERGMWSCEGGTFQPEVAANTKALKQKLACEIGQTQGRQCGWLRAGTERVAGGEANR